MYIFHPHFSDIKRAYENPDIRTTNKTLQQAQVCGSDHDHREEQSRSLGENWTEDLEKQKPV